MRAERRFRCGQWPAVYEARSEWRGDGVLWLCIGVVADDGYQEAVLLFQAEDGIRDLTVTGVQTCALPICLRRRSRECRTCVPLWTCLAGCARRAVTVSAPSSSSRASPWSSQPNTSRV